MTRSTAAPSATALLLSALVASSLAGLVAAARAKDTLSYDFLVFPTGCLNKFLAGNLFDEDMFCLKKTISKVLGYGIITGACIVKLPQILRFVAAGSVKGMSREATYLELLGYLLGSIYHIVSGNPWSAYGETVIVTVQSVLIVAMLWAYDPPSTLHMILVSGVMAALGQQAYVAPASWLPIVMQSTTLLFILSRSWQLVINFRQGSTGELAFLTLFMNFAGAAARIFTSMQEVKQIEVLASFVISTVLNGALLFQFFYYNFFSKKQAAGKASEEPKSGSSSSARRRAKRD